jgi:diguanylate cyclase (GGDEF)-like protein
MSDPRVPGEFDSELEARFLESRTNELIDINLNSFWSTAIILLGFSLWDAFVDSAHWQSALGVRLLGAGLVVLTGLFQKLPGQARWMPPLAKARLVIAVVSSAVAAALLDTGYGFGVAGLVVIILIGPYIAIDSRDLLKTNLLVVASLVPVLVAMSVQTFDLIGTIVFVMLAVAVSTLLGRILETSHRRAFALDLALHRDARTDALTGLDNRRAMQERGHVEVMRGKRSAAPVSVVMGDLDHFKNINDKYGHEVGDAALVTVASALRGALRESDALGRWGGEEFIALLPDTDGPGARDVAERMRTAIEKVRFEGISEGITISLGVSSATPVDDPDQAWDALVKTADQHLYRAKGEGRNRVVAG